MSVIIYKEGGMRPTLLIGAHVGEISEIRQLKKFLGQSLIPLNFLIVIPGFFLTSHQFPFMICTFQSHEHTIKFLMLKEL